MQDRNLAKDADGLPIRPARRWVEHLRSCLDGEVLLEGDPGYDHARHSWNARWDSRPSLIARCAGPADVMTALTFARDHTLPLAARAGGYRPFESDSCAGELLIDLSPMKGISVYPECQIASVEAGVPWGELDRATQQYGLSAPGSTISHAEVMDTSLDGSTGWLVRKHGSTADNILSAEVVTGDGTYLVARDGENQDVLEAIRAGACDFGIVTALELRLTTRWKEVSEDEAQMTWIDDTWTVVQRFTNADSHPNVARGSDDPRAQETCTAVTRERLSQLKSRYDPDNLFRLNHNIPPPNGKRLTPSL